MFRIIEVILAVLLAMAFFLVVGLFLPKTARIQRSVEVANPIVQAYDVLNGFHRFTEWNPWAATDPGMTLERQGERFGVGAKLIFTGSPDGNAGNGQLELVASELNESDASIKMELANGWSGDNKRVTFKLVQDGKTRAVNVQWDVRIEYGWDILGRYKGMYLDGTLGENMETALARFATLMATVPLVDYTQLGIEEVERTGGALLYVGGGVPSAPRKWDEEALPLMEQSWKQVEDFMASKGILPSGPKTRIINIIGEEAIDTSMAYPVADASVIPEGNVRLGSAYVGKALTVTYQRNRAGIGAPRGPREALKAYAMTHGYDFVWDGAGQFDEWLTEGDETSFPITQVYLPIAYR